MDTIRLSRKELRRFREIARGDSDAANTPAEDALIKKGLIKEMMIAAMDLTTGDSWANQRALVLTETGRKYHAFWLNEKETKRRESFRFWLTTFLAVVGIAVAVAAIIIPFIVDNAT